MPAVPEVPVIPGFKSWTLEWREPGSPEWHNAFVHIPDTIRTDMERKQWCINAGVMSASASVSWMETSSCQIHMGYCSQLLHPVQRG